MEYWDLYDEHEKLTSLKCQRNGYQIPEGLFHIVVETLIRHTDGTYLVMQRDLHKESNPGVFEGSAGGSVLAGESKTEGAKREVKEETGIVVTSLEPIYHVLDKAKRVIKQGYLTIYGGAKDAIVYQAGETISHKWLTLKELKAFIKTSSYNQNHKERLEPYLNNIKEE